MSRTPVLFVSHGSPMFAIEPGTAGARLRGLGARLDGVRAVLVISPHWQTRGLAVSTCAAPATLHDFAGFPAPLYQLRYPAPGAPASARAALDLLQRAGHEVHADPARGLDHGAWVPLLHLLPTASLPVFQVSMPRDLDSDGALKLGEVLSPLRGAGIMILCSGSLTHNLHEFGRPVADPGYAQEFADWARDAVERGDLDALLEWRTRAPHAARAHPSAEHFLPLLVAAGAAMPDEGANWLLAGMVDQVFAMDACVWGMAAPA